MTKSKRRSPAHVRRVRPPDRLDLMDEAARCCRTIAALAELLAHCEAGRLEPTAISVSGALIADEAAKLRQNLKILARIPSKTR